MAILIPTTDDMKRLEARIAALEGAARRSDDLVVMYSEQEADLASLTARVERLEASATLVAHS